MARGAAQQGIQPKVAPASGMKVFAGQCLCGQVRISVHGEPLRTGICHCIDCRHESGSAFTFYGVWPAHQFESTGGAAEFRGRHFCPRCGSRLFSVDDREPWLRPIEGAEQYEEDRN